MPTYDYRCNACGHTFELFQSMTEREKRKCPSCAKNALERLIGGGAGLIFKGSGYYLTDYRSQSYVEGQKAERSAESGSAAESPSSSEKAPASEGSASSKSSSSKEASASKSAPAKPSGSGSKRPSKPKGK